MGFNSAFKGLMMKCKNLVTFAPSGKGISHPKLRTAALDAECPRNVFYWLAVILIYSFLIVNAIRPSQGALCEAKV